MLSRILAVLLTLTLGFTTVACGSSTSIQNPTSFSNNTAIPSNNISQGKYPVQQAAYNDVDGEYTLMLLNTPSGSSPTFRTKDLQMARLTDEEINNGEKTYVDINGNQAVMHLAEDFRIEYVHNVTENRTNPDTGQPETVVVRQQSSFWAPFAGALAGQALGSLLFTPQYYVPPVYQSGVGLTGYGGYGSTYNQAVESYQSTYKSPPTVEKNRQAFRTTGSLRNSTSTTNPTKKSTTNSSKATGSGFGSSNLKTKGTSSTTRQPSRRSFGSNQPSRTRTFRGRRR